MTPPELLIGQKAIKKSQTQPVAKSLASVSEIL